jgi:hypothetical protein
VVVLLVVVLLVVVLLVVVLLVVVLLVVVLLYCSSLGTHHLESTTFMVGLVGSLVAIVYCTVVVLVVIERGGVEDCRSCATCFPTT